MTGEADAEAVLAEGEVEAVEPVEDGGAGGGHLLGARDRGQGRAAGAALVLGGGVGERAERLAQGGPFAGELGGRQVDEREGRGVLVVGEGVGDVVAVEPLEGVQGAGEALEDAVAQGERVAEHDHPDRVAVGEGGVALGREALAGEGVGVDEGDVLAADARGHQPAGDLGRAVAGVGDAELGEQAAAVDVDGHLVGAALGHVGRALEEAGRDRVEDAQRLVARAEAHLGQAGGVPADRRGPARRAGRSGRVGAAGQGLLGGGEADRRGEGAGQVDHAGGEGALARRGCRRTTRASRRTRRGRGRRRARCRPDPGSRR